MRIFLSNYLMTKLLNHIFSKGNYTPSTIYVALSNGSPKGDGLKLNEPKTKCYQRVKTETTDWGMAENASLSNLSTIEFNEATEDWGKITHFALMDSLTGGNMLIAGTLGNVTIEKEHEPEFGPGDLEIDFGQD